MTILDDIAARDAAAPRTERMIAAEKDRRYLLTLVREAREEIERLRDAADIWSEDDPSSALLLRLTEGSDRT